MNSLQYFLSLCTVIVLAACQSASDQPKAYRNLESYQASVDVYEASGMISAYRAQFGLPPVYADKKLSRVAQSRSAEVAALKGQKPSDREILGNTLAEQGVYTSYVVENTSSGYRSWAEAFSGWRQSPKHNKVMLDPNIERIGLATTYDPQSKYKVFWALVAVGS
ncbi:CAP domain-containing protein [Flexibacterium corallicola]|uniref:CAP domain-containing protein n=1 Tax=Flexibacterium corallicola TaxID=3037259 RepID=UPI00286F24E2|nr:CAP domain-containing protein [Pseudovibrio sp. M1P-2-3]